MNYIKNDWPRHRARIAEVFSDVQAVDTLILIVGAIGAFCAMVTL